ncbi:MAG: PD40 domain-containing protein [Phycisphaerales bacterium]|nr:MAG: PD40 domain-containing protein [Phycisphaerales bacterium]
MAINRLGLTLLCGGAVACGLFAVVAPLLWRSDIPTDLPQSTCEGMILHSTRGFEGADICLVNADGSGRKMITDTDARDMGPVRSPDGARILFFSDRDGDYDLYLMDMDGKNVTNLTADHAGGDMYPCWSPDGKHIAFVSNRDGDHEIYVMDGNGGDVRRITYSPGWDTKPDWSPDGRRIAFASSMSGDYDIVTVSVDGSDPVKLTDDPGSDTCPRWSPDGKRIVYSSYADDENISVMDADGSNKELLFGGGANDFVPCWSPDGRYVAFQTTLRMEDGRPDDEICIIEVQTKKLFRLTDSPGWDSMPHWFDGEPGAEGN